MDLETISELINSGDIQSILGITNYLGGKFDKKCEIKQIAQLSSFRNVLKFLLSTTKYNCQVIVSESSEILEINIKFYWLILDKTKIKFRSIYIKFTQDVFFLRKFVISGFR
ncbi:hypothetical protein BpHYR1_026376 [Brachionus plicatilis]|uniref:Uncharacterized protein n=1 Tax=Brachionus plicatilis TaxID=10195 RepID=A0A3M7RR03_BRAPC|nr:hypothetical protein BpHYR1_026376 [Brachionus plicatilis]